MTLVKLFRDGRCIFICSINCLKSFEHVLGSSFSDWKWVLTLSGDFTIEGNSVEFEEL